MKYLMHDIKQKFESLFLCNKSGHQHLCINSALLKKVLRHKLCKLKFRFSGRTCLSEQTEYSQWLQNYEAVLGEKINKQQTQTDVIQQVEFLIVLMITVREKGCFQDIKHAIDKQNHRPFSVAVFAAPHLGIDRAIAHDERYTCIECSPEQMHQRCNAYLSALQGDMKGKDLLTVFLGAGSLLSPFALNCLTIAHSKNTDMKIAYADEDYRGDSGIAHSPHYKPDWDLFLFRSQNYWGGCVSWKLDFFCQVGGFQYAIDDGMMRDIAFRSVELCETDDIVHIPVVLSHRDERLFAHGEMTVSDRKNVFPERLQAHLSRSQIEVNDIVSIDNGVLQPRYSIRDNALVSIIIPTRNGYQILKQCVDSLMALTSYRQYELIIVDNQSDCLDTLDYLAELRGHENIRVLNYDHTFNFSAINNFAVQQAKGKFLVFLNNDVEILESQWLTALVELVQQPQVGAVGAKLLYPDGLLQHAGVILGLFDIAGHTFHRAVENLPLPLHRLQVVQSYSAVTAACLAVKKADFIKVHGFNDSALKVAFNDVDLCLKLVQSGLVNLWTPYARLRHYESLTRGYEDTPEKELRFRDEIDYMEKQWSGILYNDPMYNSNLSLHSLEFQPSQKVRWFF